MQRSKNQFATTLLIVVGLAGIEYSQMVTAQVQGAPTVTVTGCVNRAVQNGSLRAAPGVPPATPATAPGLANSNEPTGAFLLNGATPVRTREAVATTGAAERETPLSYVLDGRTQEFEQHVGHQVEVTGSFVTLNEGSPRATTPVKHIKVDAIKMIAMECPKPPE